MQEEQILAEEEEAEAEERARREEEERRRVEAEEAAERVRVELVRPIPFPLKPQGTPMLHCMGLTSSGPPSPFPSLGWMAHLPLHPTSPPWDIVTLHHISP